MNSDLPHSALAAAIRDIALAAGEKITAFYRTQFEVRSKADRSPVTEADEAAEQFIAAELGKLSPRLPVVAEESVAMGNIPEVGTKPFWLVDPLDGTKEFISRNGEFTVNIGLVEDGKPTLGVVYAPAVGRLFWSAGAGRAFAERDGGAATPISARRPAADGVVVVASRSHRDPEEDSYLATLRVKSLTSAGSSLKFCLVAAGEADLYPRFGTTNEWDTAAGHAVLAAAGGTVVTRDGAVLGYAKPRFKNPGFIAKGRA
ncbi:MAG: 3'(2'),5'-bisphosphate nucleotidase CysQ [Alphaproteobacteria bacterium]|nr:3'(2'),5'-bisphosphate nucleotidase CysQ [Alphaproteobacteria bacterium]